MVIDIQKVITFVIFKNDAIAQGAFFIWIVAITYFVGTLQWFLVGGGVGALLERFFEGLKTPEPEDDEWF